METFITPAHLVFSHGYTREYAAGLTPEQREAEHNRLHEDPTAEHLAHRSHARPRSLPVEDYVEYAERDDPR